MRAKAEIKQLRSEVEVYKAELAACRNELDTNQAKLEIIKKSIRDAATVCREASRGNLESRILHIQAEGELGEMLHAINHLLDMTDAFVREAGASLVHASQEKFYRQFIRRGMHGCFRDGAELINAATAQLANKTKDLEEANAGRLKLADAFEATIKEVVENVAASVSELSSTADSLLKTADQTSGQSAGVSAAAIEAAASMETIAAATEEMAITVTEIERQAEQSKEKAQDASQGIDSTGSTVKHLTESSHSIDRVTKLITQIATQTRLLALNATIEAARAGEFGKGFAVVANEVKDLSTKTAQATKQIEGQIATIQGAADDAAGAMIAIGGTIQSVNETSLVIRDAVGQQRTATQDISASVQRAARNTRDVSQGISAVADASQKTSVAAAQVRSAARELSDLSETLRDEVEQFLHVVRGNDTPKNQFIPIAMPNRSGEFSRDFSYVG